MLLIGRQNQPIYEEATLRSMQEHPSNAQEASCLRTDGRILASRRSTFKRPRGQTNSCPPIGWPSPRVRHVSESTQ